MADLTPKPLFEGQLPVLVAGCKLSAEKPVAITSISPEKGQQQSVSAAMQKTLGLAFPAVNSATGNRATGNRATGGANLRCLWIGPGQALLLGKGPNSLRGAALTDQTDAWACLTLQGKLSEAVLARLVPLDLRAKNFKPGQVARSLLFHMPLCLHRSGADTFELMVFRSMATTAVHDLQAAMASVAAQGR